MFSIHLNAAGKKYNREWIFSNLTFAFNTPGRYVITGHNGSGKSTLLQMIAGAVIPTSGTIAYSWEGKVLDPGKIYKHISIAAPYLTLIEEFTWEEHLKFHHSLKPFQPGLSIQDVLHLSGLEAQRHKPIKYFSSGMKQRARLALAFASKTDILLLDEPLQNLDKSGMDWYSGLVGEFLKDRLCFVASNHQEKEYFFCDEEISILDFKGVSKIQPLVQGQ